MSRDINLILAGVCLIVITCLSAVIPASVCWAARWPSKSQDPEVATAYGQHQERDGAGSYLHDGIDVKMYRGEPVYAVADGYVMVVETGSTDEDEERRDLYWYVAIADQDGAGPGWVYAHLDKDSIKVERGEKVEAGDHIGYVVHWEGEGDDFDHLHLERANSTEDSWDPGHVEAIENPLNLLEPNTDETPPVVDESFFFCEDETSNYLDSDYLYGKVDIIVKAHDTIGTSHEVSVYKIEYSIDGPGDHDVPTQVLIEFKGKLPEYYDPSSPYFDIVAEVIYKNDSTCDSGERGDFYYIVTNIDGKPDGCWDTSQFPDGDYIITITVYDQAGNWHSQSMTVTVDNLRKILEDLDDAKKPEHSMDHPDDNLSVSDPDYPTPWLYDSESKVGVFIAGWGEGLNYLLGKYKTATTVVKRDLSILNEPTRSLSDVSVLLVGSAGFESLDSSPIFREQLEEYVSQGGVLVAFTTKRGYEWQPLPGGQVAGYGWDEDQSCQNRAVYIENYHQMLSGQDSAYLDVNVDGYFTRWPDDATILLRRTKNGMPAMIMYPYGEGLVIALTAYTDWGYGHGQSTEDGQILVRDIVAWASDPKELPEFSPGDGVGFSFDVTNDSSMDAAQIKLVTLDPDKNQVGEETITQAVAAGATASVTYQLPSVSSILGIWYVNYTLLDGDGAPIQDELLGERFVVSDPVEVAVEKEITFGVNSDAEHYAYGSEGVFTVLIWNNTDTTQNITCWYSFPHNYWTTHDPIYGSPGTTCPGGVSNQKRTIEVPPKGENSFIITVPLYRYDRLWADFYDESDKYLGRASRGFYTYNPSIAVSVTTDKDKYGPGESVSLSLDLQNKQDHGYIAMVNVLVLDPDNLNVFEENIEVSLPANTLTHEDVVFTLPAASTPGSYTVRVEALGSGGKIGSDSTYFKVPEVYIPITPILSGVLHSGINTLSFDLEPMGLSGISTGTLEVSLENPDSVVIWTDSRDFDIVEGQPSTVNFDVPTDGLLFGTYKLIYRVTCGAKTVTGMEEIACSCLVALSFDRRPYRIRESMRMDIDVTNNGQFLIENAAVNVSIPDMGYSYDGTVTLSPLQGTSFSLPAVIPETLSAGTHQVMVTLSLNNSTVRNFEFYIPESKLALNLDQVDYHAGDWVSVGIEDAGGVDTTAEYTISLADRNGMSVFESSSTIDLLVSTPRAIDFVIPNNVVDGEYHLRVHARDLSTDRSTSLRKTLQVTFLIAHLDVHLDKQIYRTTDSKTAISDIVVSQGAIEDGTLNLQALQAMDQQRTWTTQADWESGELHWVDITSTPGDVIVDPNIQPGVELVGKTAGRVRAVTAAGDYAYVLCAGGDLVILDVSDPSAPAVVGSCGTSVGALYASSKAEVHVAGSYAYVADRYSGLCVIDVSDPANPHQVGFCGIPDVTDVGFLAIHVVGSYAYTAAGSYGLRVIDVSDPASPQEVGSTSVDATDVYVSGSYAYVAKLYGGVSVIDVSDPANPHEVGFCETTANYIHVAGDYAYTAYGSSLRVIDISDPTSPHEVSGCGIPSTALDMYVAGGYAYVAARDDGLRVIDVSTPMFPGGPVFPYEVGAYHYDMPSQVSDLYVAGGYAYVANSRLGVRVIDISDLASIEEVGFYNTPYGPAADVYVAGNYAYVLGAGVLRVMDISDPTSPEEVGSYDAPSSASDVYVAGGYAYVAEASGLRVIDISDPTHPQEVSSFNTIGYWPDGVYVVGDYAYVLVDFYSSEGDQLLEIIDVSDPMNLQAVGFYYNITSARVFYVAEDYAYWAGPGGVRVIDVSDPTYPYQVGLYDVLYCEDDMYVTGGYMYAACGDGGLRVIDVSDPANPYEVGYYITPGSAKRVHVVGDYAYVADLVSLAGGGLRVIDISDPMHPHEVGACVVPDWARDIYATGDYAYLTFGDAGLYIFQYTKGGWLTLRADAGREANWKTISWVSDEPEGTDIKLATRTAGSEEELASADWSDYYEMSQAAITSDAGRWIEVKAVFETPDPGTLTPVLHELSIDYLVKEPVWEQDIAVDVTDTYTVSTAVEPIDGTGKFFLEGTLYSQLSQVIDTDSEIFYIDDSDIHLTFDVDKPVYKPNETVTISGEVVNDGSEPATGLNLAFRKADGTVLYEDTVDVPAGGTHSYWFNIPGSDESFILDGSLDGISISEPIEIDVPQLDVVFEHPSVVDRSSFNFAVALINPTRVDVSVHLDIEGDAQDLTIPAGTTGITQKTFSITGDTTIDVFISGEVNQDYHRDIQFGEAAEIMLSPEAIYPEGSVAIPYTVENTGSLDTGFDLEFTLDGEVETKSVFVPVGGVLSDTLHYDLTAGEYTLNYDSFFGAGSASFRVARLNHLEMSLSAEIRSMHSALILKDGGTEDDFDTILTGAGMDVTVSTVYEYEWDGTNPSPADFDVVILLNGIWPSYSNDMPTSGQTALVDYVNAGGGLIITERVTYDNRYYNHYANMTDLLLFDPNQWGYNSGTGTFTVLQDHPVTAGLPAFFSAPYHAGNLGGVKPGVDVLMTGTVLNDAVAVKEYGDGKIVQFALSGEYGEFIATAEMQILSINAATWAAGAGEDELVAEVGLSNLGCNDFTGQLQIDSDFYSELSDLTLAVEEIKSIRYNIDLSRVKPGTYDFVASALYEGNVIQRAEITIEVPGAELELTSKPDNPTYIPGEGVTMSFKVKNTGKAEGEAEVHLTVIDLLDETRMIWIRPGVEEQMDFTFVIPDDLPEKAYVAPFELNGIETEIPFTVKGVKIAVAASLDNPLYNLGDTAVLTLDITNESDLYPEMYARVKSNDYEEIQNLALAGSNTLQFNIPVDESTQEYISYGLYLTSGRVVYLNTIYIRLSGDIISLYTDEDAYMQGELVTAFVETSQAGTLSVTGPGLDMDVDITGPDSFDFMLPSEMVSGTYSIDWIFGGHSGFCDFGVLGYSARILECELDKETYDPIDEMNIAFRIEVNQDISGVLKGWLLDPTGNYSDLFELSQALAEGENEVTVNVVLSTPYSEIHRVLYGLYKSFPDLLLASGAESFDVRAIALTGLSTLDPTYEREESVQARVNAFASEAFSGDIRLSVDDTEVMSEPVSFTGYQEFTYNLGTFAPGEHTLSAELISDSAVISQREASFMVVDTIPPTRPTGLSASVEGGTAILGWNANPEPDLEGYHLYRNGARFTVIPITGTMYRDTSLVANTDYTYYITAIDEVGNESEPSDSVTLGVDSIPPVITLSPSTDVTSVQPVTVTYTVTDNVDPSPAVTANYPSPTTFDTNGVYTVNVSAEDSSGNTSSRSVTITIERKPPAQVTTLQATDARIGGTVDLDWTGYDEAGENVISYNIYQSESDFTDVTGGTMIAAVAAGTFSYRVTGLTDGIRYYFAVAPVNSDGIENTSVQTASAIPSAIGNISISSEPPGAMVYLGGNYGYLGEYQGVTPITIVDLPRGKYVVRLTLAGYEISYDLVEVAGGATTELSVMLVGSIVPQYTTSDILKDTTGAPLYPSSYPVAPFVVDWNMDGKKDVLIGDAAGAIHYYENIGTDESPELNPGMTVLTGSGTDITVFIVDWNNNGKKDLLMGDGVGNVTVYLNNGIDAEPAFDSGTVVVNVGNFAIPWVVDWSNDHKKDLLVGDGNGALNLFLNMGTDASPAFGAPTLVMADGVPLSVGGNAAPCVLDWDADGKKDLLIGCTTGEVYVYLNTGADDAPSFTTGTPIQAGSSDLSVGENSIPFVLDWDNDNLKDLVIGDEDGLVHLFLVLPIVDAGPDVTMTSMEQLSTTIVGSAFDQNDDPLTYRWLEGAIELLNSTPVDPSGSAPLDLSTISLLTLGDHIFTLEVSDGKHTVTDDMILTVNNSAPAAAPTGGGVYVYGSDITLGGSVSDFDGDTLLYEWYEGADLITSGYIDTMHGGEPVPLPDYVIIGGLWIGEHSITLTVSDGINDAVSADVQISVIDTTAPTLAPEADTTILWPPDHKMRDVIIYTNANDDSGSVTISVEVFSDEPPDTDGDGNTIPDHEITHIDQENRIIYLQLRAERSGEGDGREYTISITASDPSGNSSEASLLVMVPHDSRP